MVNANFVSTPKGARHAASLYAVLVAVFVAWFVVLGDAAVRTADADLLAGASAVNISPRKFPVIRNGGFTEAQDTRLADPLFARTLALRDDQTTLVLVVVDSCMIPRELADEIKATAAQRCGITPDHIMISATHTHAAPSVMDYCLGSRADPDYTASLPEWIVAGIEQALARLEPAQIAWAARDAGDFTHCRRWITRPDAMRTDPFGEVTIRANMHPGHMNPEFTGPSGPTDPWLTLLSVQSVEGRPIALLANFAMHYFSGHNGISADYFGRYAHQMQQRIAADNPQFVAMMSQGTSGDLWWGDYSRSAEAFRPGIDQFAQGLVELTEAALAEMTYQRSVPLKMAERRMVLERRRPDATRLAWAREMLSRMGDRRPQNQPEVYAEQAVYLDQNPECQIVLQAIRIGEFGIATWPNEVYGLSGLKIHLRSPLPWMMNIELANGAAGYIPPPEQHRLGGYNTWPARTAGLEVQAEPKIVEALLQLLEAVSGRPRRVVNEPLGPAAQRILAARPVAYYRAAELEGAARLEDTVLADATGQGRAAKLVGNFAFYLPGVDRLAFVEPAATGSSHQPDQNRALHSVGGRVETPFRPGASWSAELWVWNGLLPETRAVTGTVLAHGPAVLQISGKDSDRPGCLTLGGQLGRSPLGRFQWHHIAYVQRDERIEVYLDGKRELAMERAELAAASRASNVRGTETVCFGADASNSANWEGRFDELALYDDALEPAVIEQHATVNPLAAQPATPADSQTTAHSDAAAVDAPPSGPQSSVLPDGDAMLSRYFQAETARLRDACLADIDSLEQWQALRDIYRQQLLHMLGLDPWPERTELKPVTTNVTAGEGFRVERVQFQSMPGLYVTGNLYLPEDTSEPLPAILYVCGHGGVKQDGISYGNKVHYQHHGAWFARHGYVCLTIDSLQLGEIESIHHGLYREGMWWWMNRGYTPAGVEAWNCVRSLDYLQSRPEVDGDRLGVTGRSGGGAYSWWIAAIDDRIKAAVPVAGITDLENHVVDGCVEGHCDCMYLVNTFQWDYPLVAALVAPRPLLISNTDRDSIFPLEGVVRVHAKVRKIYELYGAAEQLGLQITSGPHEDTQELRVHAFRWFDEHLKNVDRLIERPAVKYFEPVELRVFSSQAMPADQRNTSIHESFVAAAASDGEVVPGDWQSQLEQWVFRAWPSSPGPLRPTVVDQRTSDGATLSVVLFDAQPEVRLPLYIVEPRDATRDHVIVEVLDAAAWARVSAAFPRQASTDATHQAWRNAAPRASAEDAAQWLDHIQAQGKTVVYVAPRGIGPTRWTDDEREDIHIRRRFFLLGQTLDGMRIWDVRRAIAAARESLQLDKAAVEIRAGGGTTAAIGLYAALFEPSVTRLSVDSLPASHRDGPYLVNVRRVWDLPQAIAAARQRIEVNVGAQQ